MHIHSLTFHWKFEVKLSRILNQVRQNLANKALDDVVADKRNVNYTIHPMHSFSHSGSRFQLRFVFHRPGFGQCVVQLLSTSVLLI
jgi:hypothetical protein